MGGGLSSAELVSLIRNFFCHLWYTLLRIVRGFLAPFCPSPNLRQEACINRLVVYSHFLLIKDHYGRHGKSSNRAVGDTTFAKKGKLPQESYVSHMRVRPFSSSLLTSFPAIYIYFEYFYRFSRHTRTSCKNLLVNLSIIEVFMAL